MATQKNVSRSPRIFHLHYKSYRNQAEIIYGSEVYMAVPLFDLSPGVEIFITSSIYHDHN